MRTDLFDKIVHRVVYKGKKIERVFAVLFFICILCFPFVGVNYDLSDYLPGFAPSKKATPGNTFKILSLIQG